MQNHRALSVSVALVMALAVVAPLCADDYSDILTYKFGQSRKALSSIEASIRTAKGAEVKAIETKLIGAMNAPTATFECKQFVCRMLRRIGTDQSVDSLAALLTDEKLSHMARFALQRMPSDKVDAVLREALGKVDDKLKVGIVSSIADRRDRKAVDALAKLTASANADLAGAALAALGRIGGEQAAAAISGATVSKALAPTKADAHLMCADSLTKEGKTSAAAAIYTALSGPGNPKMVRVAAFQGLVATDPAGMMPKVMAMLKGDDVAMQRAASRIITAAPGAGVTKAVAAQLGSVSDEAKVILLTALATRGDRAATPAVARSLASSNEAVRIAAIRTLAAIGDATCVAPLTKTATAGGQTAKAALDTLSRLTGDGVDNEIIACFAGKTSAGEISAVRTILAKVAALRQATAVVPCIIAKGATDSNPAARQASYEAIGALAGPNDLGTIVSMLVANTREAERATLEQALAVSAGRVKDVDARAAAAIAALPKGGAARGNLMNVLARLGGDKARKAVEGQLSGDARTSAIRALAAWGDASPLASLQGVASSDSNAVNKVLALRGVIRLAAMPSKRSDAETVTILAGAMKLASRADEKRSILAILPRTEKALAIAQSCTSDAAVKAEAALAVRKIKMGILRKTMKAGAARNPKTASAVLDGKRTTYWTTGKSQNKNDWFSVDMGATQKISIITIDCGEKVDDYPRTVEISVSADGKNWGRSVVKANGTQGITTVKLRRAVSTRYIRIAQTGRAGNNWSMAELYVE